ncbi:MAG: segregation/condensation protein A [Actinobacteria bacterium]|nr:MAG: segregation/condensation protein A [Actinomycetota bacterium]
MPYDVSTPVFEGPFDLLLHLVTKEQVDLYEVSLGAIIAGYIEHLEHLEHLDLEVATEFVLIAATLIELKTRRLLPGRDDDVELDEELGLWEERDLLIARLIECKTFKDAGLALERMAARADRSRPRTCGMEERFLALVPDVLAGVTAARLHDACVRALTPRPLPRVDLDHVAPIRLSVGDAVDALVDELAQAGTGIFGELTAHLAQPLEVIVWFLAVLELYKDGRVELDQLERFGELRITWLGQEHDGDDGTEEHAGEYVGAPRSRRHPAPQPLP